MDEQQYWRAASDAISAQRFNKDEAIICSQLEGTAPRGAWTPDERMIVGNYWKMNLAWDNCNRDLLIEMIAELHRAGWKNIDDYKYCPG